MQSATSRLNNITMFGATVLLAMSILNYIHGRILYSPTPTIDFKITEIPQFRTTNNWEALTFKYNLNADLSSLYTWNLKQLFVYIQVEWENQKGLNNRMIVNDWILESPWDRSKVADIFKINVKDKQIEYSVRDVHKSMRGKKLKVSLNVEYMPTVGIFFKDRLQQITLEVPSDYLTR